MTLTHTRAYGLWQCVLRLPDGRTLTAWGLTAGEAAYRARLLAKGAENGRLVD